MSSDPQLRRFAREMIETHTDRLHTLGMLLSDTEPGLKLSMALSLEQQQMLTALKRSGAGFGTLYKQDMELVHAQAFGLFQTYTSSATANARLRTFAQNTLATVKQHWQNARDLPGLDR